MNICHLILFSIGPYHTHQPYLPATKKTRNPMFLASNFISGWVYRPSTQCGDLQYLPSLPGVVPSLINFCDHAINNATGYCHIERDLIIFVMSLMSVCFSKRASTKKKTLSHFTDQGCSFLRLKLANSFLVKVGYHARKPLWKGYPHHQPEKHFFLKLFPSQNQEELNIWLKLPCVSN